MEKRISDTETPTTHTVEKAIDVLTYVMANVGNPSLSSISQDLSLNKSTVYRLLSCLTSKGVLEKDSTNHYRAGVMLFQWCTLLSQQGGIVSLVLPFLQQLENVTGETASLHLRVSRYQVCIEQAASHHELRHIMGIGRPVSLGLGAAGKIILAYLPSRERQSIINSYEDHEVIPADRQALEAELSAIMARGLAFSFGERFKGASGVAAPVLNSAGRVVGSVTLSGPETRLTLTELQANAQSLREVAGRISWEFGYRGSQQTAVGR